MPTILITGCSSGFGLATAACFAGRGWDVVAAMRTPREDFPQGRRERTVALDVTDAGSIARAVAAAGPIDALVNNAGIGVINAAEGTPIDVARAVFETNTLGTIAMTQAFLPQFRERRAGVIVNVSSAVTHVALPLMSAYAASKAAVNAFSDSLAVELAPFDVRVHVILPGRAPDTSFAKNCHARRSGKIPESYAAIAQEVFAKWERDASPVITSADVAEAIWRAVNDARSPPYISPSVGMAAV